MELLEVEKLAAQGADIPNNTTFSQKMYYCQMRALYFMVKQEGITKEKGKSEKAQLLKEYENCQQWEYIFKDETRIRNELNKLTAPMAELKNKSKEELLKLIERILMLHDGRIQKADEKI